MSQSEPPFSFRAIAARAVLAAFAVVLALSAAWALRAPAEAQSIRDGSFIRQSNTADVYRVNIVNGKRFKWLVVNEDAFCSYGCPWGSVINVSRSVMARYTTSYLARQGSNRQVWRFAPSGDSGTRRWLNITAREFEDADYDWDAVHSITATDFNQYRRGRDITARELGVGPPTITNEANLSFAARERVSNVSIARVRDPDDTLRLSSSARKRVSVSGLPSGLRVANYMSDWLTISGTAPSRTGSHTVTITATDGPHTVQERFTITIRARPQIVIRSDQSWVAGSRVSERVATVSDPDTPLRNLTVRVTGLPSGIRYNFSTSNGRVTVSGTVGGSAQNYTARVSASDGTHTTRKTFRVFVTPAPNAPPEITNLTPPLTVTEGQSVAPTQVATVTDRDDTLRLNTHVTISGLPSGLSAHSLSSSGRLTISGTVAADAAGTYTPTVTANDRVNPAVTRNFRITVSETHDPVVTLADDGFTVQAGERMTSRRVATISDRDTALSALTVNVSGLPSGWTHSFGTSNGRLTVSGTAPSSAGTHRVTVTASDGRGSDTERFTITVSETHDPEITLANDGFSVQTGERVTSRRVATMSDRDTALSALTVNVSGLPSGWTHSFSTSNGRLTVSGTAPSSAGTHRVTITASDGRGSDTERFTITVAAPPPDCAATIQSGSFVRRSGTEDVYRVKIVGSKRFKWLLLNEAAFNSYGVAWSRICDTSQSVLNRYTTSTLARNGDDPKVWQFEHTGSDTGRRLSITAQEFERRGYDRDAVFSLQPGDFNAYEESTTPPPPQLPVINIVSSSVTWVVGQRVSQHVATVTDADSTLSARNMSVHGLPGSGWTHDYDSRTGRLTINGTVPQTPVSTTATVTASDGTLSAAPQSFRVTVRGNLPPVITVLGDRAFCPGEQVGSVQIAQVKDPDDRLQLREHVTVNNLPPGLSADHLSSSSGSLMISGTMESNTHGKAYKVTIQADDGSNSAVSKTLTIAVCGDESDRIWGVRAPGDLKRVQGEWTETDPTANPAETGMPTDTYSFQLTSAARVVIELHADHVHSDLQFASGSRDYLGPNSHGNPDEPARLAREVGAGNHWIHAAALWEGRLGKYTLVVEFEELIGPPTFGTELSEVSEPLIRGKHRELNLPGRASGGYAPLTYTLRDKPEGMTFDANDLTLTGTPTGAAGEYTMRLRATDDAGRWDEQQIRYTISLGEIKDGSLIRQQGTADVYLVQIADGKQFKRRILNRAVFNGYGWDRRDVHDVSADVMGAYTTSSLGQLAGDPKVWLLDAAAGTRHWLNMTPAQFEAAGHDWDAVYTISQAEFNRWVEGGVRTACLPEEDPFTLVLEDGESRDPDDNPFLPWPGIVAERTGSWTSTDCTSKHAGRSGSYSDTWGFVLTDQADVTIDLASTNADAYVYLVDNNGIVVEQDDDDGRGRDARISRTLLPGTYWVRATTKSPRDQGSYELTIAARPGSCSLATIDLTPGEGREVQGEWAVSDCLWDIPGEPTDTYHDRFVLRLSRGAKVMLHLNHTGDVQPVLSVWRERTKLREVRLLDGGADEVGISLSIGGGDYWIDVTTVSARDTGSYALTLTTEPTYTIERDLGTLESFHEQEVWDFWLAADCPDICPEKRSLIRLSRSAIVDLSALSTTGGFTGLARLYRETQDGSLEGDAVLSAHQVSEMPGAELDAGLYVLSLTGISASMRNTTLFRSVEVTLTAQPTKAESLAIRSAIAEAYAPIMTFDSRERYFPVPIEAMLDHSDLRMRTGGVVFGVDTGLRPGTDTLSKSPSKVGLGVHAHGNSHEQHLDFDREAWDRSSNSAEYQEKYPPTIYARVDKIDGNLVLQYWIFYVYNPGPITRISAGLGLVNVSVSSLEVQKHEGDWEGIQIVFGRSIDEDDVLAGIGTGSHVDPLYVEYATHKGGERHCWSDAVVSKAQGVRVQVYPALGSHATYPEQGERRASGLFIPHHLQGKATWWDINDGGGKVLEQYDVELIDHSTGWLQWHGRWGVDERRDDDIIIEGLGLDNMFSGPQGPNTKRRWSDLSWTGGGRQCG